MWPVTEAEPTLPFPAQLVVPPYPVPQIRQVRALAQAGGAASPLRVGSDPGGVAYSVVPVVSSPQVF
jgi:hypothetical protein